MSLGISPTGESQKALRFFLWYPFKGLISLDFKNDA
jgi:hypothetical protein